MYLYKLQPSSHKNPLAISMVTVKPTVQRLWDGKETSIGAEKLAGLVQVRDDTNGTKAGEPGRRAVL